MPAYFEPILKKMQIVPGAEGFVSSNESLSIITKIFISAGLMILAMVITWLFISSYEKDKNFFIGILSVVALMFSIEYLVLTIINMSKYDELSFKVAMGSTIVACLMFLIVAMIFFIKFFQSMRSSGSYVPSSVQSYIDQ